MGIKEKVSDALVRRFRPVHLELIDEDGVSGYVVSDQFQGLSALDRQREIDRALRDPASKLSAAQRFDVLAIAAMTPVEYEVVKDDGR